MARRQRSFISVNIDQASLKEVDLKLSEMIMAAKPEITRKVTLKVYADVQASGNIPKDTGNLRSQGVVFKDHFDPTAYTMGWHTEYAKTMFYGVKSIKEWSTQGGKRMAFYSSKSGMPFWTNPFLKNKSYMLGLYSKYSKEAFNK